MTNALFYFMWAYLLMCTLTIFGDGSEAKFDFGYPMFAQILRPTLHVQTTTTSIGLPNFGIRESGDEDSCLLFSSCPLLADFRWCTALLSESQVSAREMVAIERAVLRLGPRECRTEIRAMISTKNQCCLLG